MIESYGYTLVAVIDPDKAGVTIANELELSEHANFLLLTETDVMEKAFVDDILRNSSHLVRQSSRLISSTNDTRLLVDRTYNYTTMMEGMKWDGVFIASWNGVRKYQKD